VCKCLTNNCSQVANFCSFVDCQSWRETSNGKPLKTCTQQLSLGLWFAKKAREGLWLAPLSHMTTPCPTAVVRKLEYYGLAPTSSCACPYTREYNGRKWPGASYCGPGGELSRLWYRIWQRSFQICFLGLTVVSYPFSRGYWVSWSVFHPLEP
jgi:hypothetical protein